MAVTKITWENKTGIQNDASVARKNKVTDEDMNEIKQTVNNNADELDTVKDNIEDLQGGQGTANTDITSLKNRVTTLESSVSNLESNKVDKVEGKGLSTEDFTTELKTKLEGLNNYDDTEIKGDISNIQQEQQTQNTNIEGLQENDIEQDELISKLQEDNQKLKNALLNAETEEAKSLHVEDANRFGSLEVLGNHEQETRSGKNLLNFSSLTTQTVNGLTITNNNDGSITLNGTTTDIVSMKLSQTMHNLVAGNYYLSRNSSGTASGTFTNILYGNNGTAVNVANLVSEGMPLTTTTDYEEYYLWLYITSGITFTNYTIKPQLEAGTVKTDWEQYGASPSPDYPSKVVCLGSNKNLLHMQEKSYTQLGVNVTQKESCLKLDGTTNEAQNILSGGYVDIGNFKKGKYSFKAHISGSFERQGKNDFAFYIRKKDDTSKIYGSIGGTTIENSRNSFTFELTEDTDLVIQIWANASGIIFNNFEMKLKVEEGETATGYSPYRTR